MQERWTKAVWKTRRKGKDWRRNDVGSVLTSDTCGSELGTTRCLAVAKANPFPDRYAVPLGGDMTIQTATGKTTTASCDLTGEGSLTVERMRRNPASTM